MSELADSYTGNTRIMVMIVMTEMAGVVMVTVGAQCRYDGPMGKSDHAFVFGTLRGIIFYNEFL